MKKWIPIILGSIGSFFILKSIFKLNKEQQKVIILAVTEDKAEKPIPVKEKVVETPAPKGLNSAPSGTYLESGKVRLNSKR